MLRRTLLAAVTLGLALPSLAAAAPDPTDTRLLSQPAAGKDRLAFVYADDLWVAGYDGDGVRRLTSFIGEETSPAFSPDGDWIAFTGEYDGNQDVYLIPATGGEPKRLTYHPGTDTVLGFTPDGKSVLFASAREVFTRRYTQFFTVPVEGGFPTKLPIPNGSKGRYSPDGTRVAYTPLSDRFTQWKNYRGGTNSRIWVLTLDGLAVEQIPQPEGRCNDTDPFWVSPSKILFRSDRNGELNLFTYDLGDKAVKQFTEHNDFPVLDLSVNGENAVYEQAGYLHQVQIGDNGELASPRKLTIGVAADLPERRARYVDGEDYVRGAAVSPSGARAILEVRGEILTVPADKGDPRNLTMTTSAHERDPSWSPDGKTVAYFSDASGDYQLVLEPQDGRGEERAIPLQGAGFYRGIVWSPDSKKLLYTDNASSLYLMDVESGKITPVVEEPPYGMGRINASSWSADGQWIAYSQETPAQISRVHVYSVKDNKSHAITDGLSEAAEPVFDKNGKYLYFRGSTDTGMSKHGFMQSSGEFGSPDWSLYLAVLQKDEESPFRPESDEEGAEDEDDDEDQERPNRDRDEGDGDAQPGEERRGQGEGRRGPGGRRPGGREDREPEPVTIDFEGIDQRILSLPVGSGSYSNLQTGRPGQLFYISRSGGGGGGRGRGVGGGGGGTLQRFNIDDRESSTIQASVSSYELTPDASKMLYSSGRNNYFITNVGRGGGGSSASRPTAAGRGGPPGRGPGGPGRQQESEESGGGGGGRLNLAAIQIKIDPVAEWPQIYNEAWRINRDFFYAPNMHGADWQRMRVKYEPFLSDCATRNDVNRVIQWLCSELAVGHHRGGGGDRLYDNPDRVGGGLLGADFEIADGRYRFKKVYGGLNWTPGLRAPLTEPGVNVKEGEYLLKVRGVDLTSKENLFELFENTSGKQIELTVGPNADGTESRTVVVEPIGNDSSLRNRAWVEGNLKKVAEATDGKVAYVYVPDTAGGGREYFKRYFFPQVDKQAIIIDERFNSGGQIADYYIDNLRKPFLSYWAPRHGADWVTPSAAIQGPKVMIIDETAGSGGDMLPWMFRKLELGTLIGKRTWGGLVGVGGYPTLMDGGSITAPHFAIWSPDEGFIVENQGVPPDVEVEQLPADVMAGRDPQLEKAIEIVKKQLEENPPPKHTRPPFPVRALPGSQGKPKPQGGGGE